MLGSRVLDEQHRALINSINDLYEARFDGSSEDRIISIVRRLIQQTVDHFSSEEQEMLKIKFPEYEDHVNAHRMLLEDAEKYLDRFKEGEDISIELQQFLFDWLTHHILVSDVTFLKYSLSLQTSQPVI